MFDLQNTGPVPDDLGTRMVFEKVRVPLPRLIEAAEISQVPIDGCVFEGCLFSGVGFAGNDAFVEAFVSQLSSPKA